ncbi:MAG: hypothetical protein Q8K86_00965 [Candidatus Nanopelagicaceae bacterium]|nr:hypothetical protein [Candidatus Nanopelagicaceae bacterium]
MNKDCVRAPVERPVMPRYGIKWNGAENPIAIEMDDGYWTPWHIANDTIMKLQIEVDVQSYWGPKWEAEHAEVTRLRQILQDNGIDA